MSMQSECSTAKKLRLKRYLFSMKKFIILLGAMIMTSGNVFAQNCEFMCPQNPYAGSYSFSNIVGTNYTAEKIANAIIKKQILKESTGNYRVNLQSYNVASLKKGIFKSLEIIGEDTLTDEIYISYLKFKTLCDYNYIEVNDREKTITFKENFGMAYALQFTEDDLNKTMKSSMYNQMVRKVNSIGNSSKLFNISSTSVKIMDDKLIYMMKVSVPLFNMKQDVAVQTDLKVRNGEIVVKEANLITEHFKVDVNKLALLINYLNPLDFSMNLMKNKDANMQVKEISIKNSKVNVSGLVTVDKDVITEQ